MTHWHPLPRNIYKLVEETPGTVLLHSSRPGRSVLSQLFTDPIQIIEVSKVAELSALLSSLEDATESGLFAAGYFGYECGQYFEPAAGLRPRWDADLLAWFGIYDRCYVFDHRAGRFDQEPPRQAEPPDGLGGDESDRLPAIDFALNEQEFAEQIRKIHDWIRAGDVYQVNFTFPLKAGFAESACALYDRLADAQPVDYGAFLHTRSGRYTLSFSPELFFRIDGERHITTQPMKGTAPRGRTTSEDGEIAAWLANDPKNRAENVMIVDLIRNDLGRICSFGSVKVQKLFEVERYPSLWQMTSRISGDLRPNTSYQEIFRALFPSGSVTGAPKVRAMQLLGQIEKEPRGIYTGAIGYFSREETAFNVAIRTLEFNEGSARMGIGSGIVIDSEPAAEYRECRLKAEFLTRTAAPFSLIETVLWEGTFPLLELHLDRLADSAAYFDFECDRDAIRNTLLADAARFLDNQPRRVRLLLDRDGAVRIESALLPVSNPTTEPLRVCFAAERTDPTDRFLFHKTTRRELYRRAVNWASERAYAEVLFMNTRDEVTEGAVDNLFIERSGRWYTPPLNCGVLPGVYRRHLLSTRSDIEERILTLNDVKAADGVYICNAVRGLRRVSVDWEASLGLTEL